MLFCFCYILSCIHVLRLQRKNDEDKKNRSDDVKFSQSRQTPVKQVMLYSSIIIVI